MKNQLLLSTFILFTGLCFCNAAKSQSDIIAVGTGEYVTTYLKNDGTAWVANQANVNIVTTQYSGLGNIVGMDGMQYSTAAWDASGNVYKLTNNASYTKVAVDNLGNPFTGNTLVRGLYQSCLSIRNGEVWYWGLDDVLNQTGGPSMVPVKLIPPPGNRIITDIQAASSTSFGVYTYAWGLASDGTLWQWDRTNTTPFQVTGGWGGTAIVKIALVGNWAKVVVTANNQIWGWGFTGDYIGAAPQWQNPNPINVTNLYTSKGVSFPLKEIVGGSNTLHIIDANDHLFGIGDNTMGEVGNGGGNSFWATAGTPYNWSWNAYGEMTGLVHIPGKFKNFRAGNTVTFYKYVQDLEGNWYSWGRNKSFSLGNGISLPSYAGYPGTTGINYADNPNFYDVTGLRKVTPLAQTWVITPAASRSEIRPPMAYAGADRVFPAGTNSVTLHGAAKQLQPTSLVSITTTNQWTLISGPNTPSIVSAGSLITDVNNLVPGIYKFRNTVTNALGMIDYQETKVTIHGSAVNQLPTANAGSDISVTLPTNSATLSGSGNDPDGNIISYNWQKISGPASGVLANANAATANASSFVEGVYQYELTVTDNVGAAAKDTMTLTVIPAVNQLPTANAGADISITLPTNSATLSGSGNDSDGNIISYNWQKISGPASGVLANANTATANASSLVAGIYQYELTVTDNDGAAAKDTMTLTVTAAANQLPTASAGADINITLPTNSADLSGSGNDPDGTIFSYTWQKITGPASGVLANANAATANASSLDAGVYKFELTVTDNIGAAAKDTMTLTVMPSVNQLPTVNAGLDISITLPNNSVILSGSGNDPDGNIISYNWQKISGPASGVLANANAATANASSLVAGVYEYELTVTDNLGASAKDTMTLTVIPAVNQLPTANAGSDISITLPNNSATLNGSGNDPDGNIISYNWEKISGPASGVLANANAATTNASSLVAGVYKYELTVTDNLNASAKDTMTLTVIPAANQLPTANAGADISITLPTNSATLSGSGNDPDGTIFSYTWQKISGPIAGVLANANAATANASSLVAGIYQFELTVTDNDGADAKDTMTLTVIPAANQLPTANAGSDISITLPTNSATLSGSGNDPDGTIFSYTWRKISGPVAGILANANAATANASSLVAGVYKFELTVTDNVGAAAKDTMTLTVIPAPNQLPTANAGADISITLPVNFAVLSGKGTDTDGSITSYSWQKISGPITGTITNNNIANANAVNLVAGTYKIQLTVTDNVGAVGRDTMILTVVPAPNMAPTAHAGNDINLTLPVNTVVLAGRGLDADGLIIAYQWSKLGGPAAGTLTNATTATPTLNGLVAGVYTYQLTVTDNSGATGKDSISITVSPAPNIKPVANAGADVNIYLPDNGVALTGAGEDVDGSISAYKWKVVSGPAQYFFGNDQHAQTSLSNLMQGVYVVELTVTDNGGATGSDSVIITVGASRTSAQPNEDKLIAYPNPVTTVLNANISSSKADRTVKMMLYDSKGMLVFSKEIVMSANSQIQQVNMANMRSGIYLLTVEFDANTRITQKIIKN